MKVLKNIKSKQELEKYTEFGNVVLFFSKWCPHIKKEIDESIYQNVSFIFIDVDTNEELVFGYYIKSLPFFEFFKNGKRQGDYAGNNKCSLDESIKKTFRLEKL
jgi:thiol-disulfide isomerase/thioredoxin